MGVVGGKCVSMSRCVGKKGGWMKVEGRIGSFGEVGHEVKKLVEL